MTDVEKRQRPLAGPAGLDLRPRAGVHRHPEAPRALRPLHRRRMARCEGALHDDLAARRGTAGRGRAGQRRRRPFGRRGGPRRFQDLVEAARLRSGEVPVPDRADPRRALSRVRRARVAERRQADQGVARRRPPARSGAFLLLRGLGRQARIRVSEPPSEAARSRRPDHPVELPAPDARRGRSRRRSQPATPSC